MAKDLLSDFDKAFEELENPDLCDLLEVNPSKPGWQVVLHFDDQEFDTLGTLAQKDLWMIQQWEGLGSFAVEVRKVPNRTVTLTFNEECGVDQFSPDQLRIFSKYRPTSTAPAEFRNTVVVPEALRSIDEIDDDNPRAMITDVSALIADECMDVFDDEVVVIDEDEAVRLRGFKFELVELHLNPNDQGYEAVVTKIEKIADEEELDINIDPMPSRTLIYLYRQEGVNYAKPMDEQNAAELEFYLSKIL